MSLQLYDEVGNPFPAGVQVNIYPAGVARIPANLAATDWTQAGGLCPNVNLDTAVPYTATFVGRQGPSIIQNFAGGSNNATSVVVSPYRSPCLTATNYGLLQTQVLWPKGEAWWGDQYRQVGGGVAWALAYALGAIFALYDNGIQGNLQSARVQSSANSAVDTWAFDFLGQWLPRYEGESDLSYKGRIYAALSAPKTTLQAIQNVVVAFYVATQLSTSGLLGFDTPVGSFDSSQGAMDLLSGAVTVPTILVWDRQSRPDLANLYGINPGNNDGSFVIQIGFGLPDEEAWYLDYSCLDNDSFLLNILQWQQSLTAPDPRLGALVNFTKSAGRKPIYLTSITST